LAKELFNARIGDDNLLHSLNQPQSIPGGVAPPRFDPSTRPPVDINTSGRVRPPEKKARRLRANCRPDQDGAAAE
jgi:hypothetical protein